jgi:hypothetical protein
MVLIQARKVVDEGVLIQARNVVDEGVLIQARKVVDEGVLIQARKVVDEGVLMPGPFFGALWPRPPGKRLAWSLDRKYERRWLRSIGRSVG